MQTLALIGRRCDDHKCWCSAGGGAVMALRAGGQIKVRNRYDKFIGGEWVALVKGQYFDNRMPISGAMLHRRAFDRRGHRESDAMMISKAGETV